MNLVSLVIFYTEDQLTGVDQVKDRNPLRPHRPTPRGRWGQVGSTGCQTHKVLCRERL